MKIPDYVSRTAMCALIDEWVIGNNNKKKKKIMKRRLIDGICIEPLAEEFEMSVRQINDIIRACEARISPHI